MYILNVYEQPYYMCIQVLLLAYMVSIYLWLH
jgi:hypothetical protein